MTTAGFKDWQAVQDVGVREDLLLGKWGSCVVLAGMRTQTLVDQVGLWFQGTDGRTEFVSVKVDRESLNRLEKP
jgi:hypothetical protein